MAPEGAVVRTIAAAAEGRPQKRPRQGDRKSTEVMDLRHLRSLGLAAVGGQPLTLGRGLPQQVQPVGQAAASGGYPASPAAASTNAGTRHEAVIATAPASAVAALTEVGASSLASAVVHASALPNIYAEKVPESDERVLHFLLSFLDSEGLSAVQVYINGGYVRDLLLGKTPDDLDLSLCLRDCPEDVTVGALMEKLPAFAKFREDLGIVEVKIATILSNESKDKQLDTFKGHFTNREGKKIEVDVMPTIGEEMYEEGNRIPIRDERGTPAQDALRRDLTIGAMLLRVSSAGQGVGLNYEIFDFYGGIEDLRRGVLRAPVPLDKSLDDIRHMVLFGETDVKLAADLGVDVMAAQDPQRAMQALWWAKILADDPLRICRALRFVTKLKFVLHDTFWLAAAFVLQALRSKVAGSRKNTEYQKIAGYGFTQCQKFFELAFAHTFGLGGKQRLASALFGGQDDKGRAKSIDEVTHFDLELFRSMAEPLRDAEDPAMITGGCLAAGIFASKLEGGRDAPAEFQLACDGMCVSNMMRDTGNIVFVTADKMATSPAKASSLEHAFAKACGVSVEKMTLHVQVWDALQLSGAPAKWPVALKGIVQRMGLKMLRHKDAARADIVEACLEVLTRGRPGVRGGALDTPGVLQVPNVLRKQVITLLEVILRILGCDDPVEDGQQLQQLLTAKPTLAEALSSSVWYKEDGKTLKDEFLPQRQGKAVKKK